MTMRGAVCAKSGDAALDSAMLGAAAGMPLPSPRGVALEVMRLTRDDSATVSQIADALSADPAIAGRLVDVANCASRVIRRPVVAVRDAVIVLGLGAVRQLTLGFSLLKEHGRGECVRFGYQEFWSHSLLLALASEGVARRVGHAAPEEMFACGLLAQVGRLAFATLYPTSYSDIVAAAETPGGESLRMLEREQFGLDHVEMSMIMLREWGLPDVFVRAVGAIASERRGTVAEQPRVAAVMDALRLAWNIGLFLRGGTETRDAMTPPLLEQASAFELESEGVAELVDTTGKNWTDWARRFQLPATMKGDPAATLRKSA